MNRKNKKSVVSSKKNASIVVAKTKLRIPKELLERMCKRNAGIMEKKKYTRKVKHKKMNCE